jgi:hypothetical protein
MLEHDIDTGQPGASARAEYERRQRADNAQRSLTFGRYLSPVVKLVTGEPQSTRAWDQGGRGEEWVGRQLDKAVGLDGVVLHDRSIPGSSGNIDHIAIVPSGVWIIDTKNYTGRVEERDLGRWFVSRPALFVNGRDRSSLVGGVLRQVDRVEPTVRAVDADVPMFAVLCFAAAEWGYLGRPFTIDDVYITWANKLSSSLVARGPLSVDAIRTLATRIAATFPAYAPSGTSQSPTGA